MVSDLIKRYELPVIIVLAITLSFLIFGNSLKNNFVFDDVAAVQNRGDLKDWSNFFNLFVSPYHQNIAKTGLYRPVTMASYSLNFALFGESAAAFRLVNILIHALNSVLVFWLIKFLTRAGRIANSKRLAFFSFLIFLAHPLHTEAVIWIVGRAELLAFFFGLMAIYFFIKKDRLLSSLAFLLALGSKEIALMVWPVIVFIDWNFQGRKLTEMIKTSWFFSIPLAVYAFFRYWALGQYFSGDITTTMVENPLKFAPFFERIFTALKVLSLYVWKMIWPIHLSADYSYDAIKVVKNVFSSPAALTGLAILVFLLWCVFSPKIRKTLPGAGAAIFLAPYLMISNLVFPVGTIMGERLVYFSSLGFVIFLAWLIDKLFFRSARTVRYIGCAALFLILIFYGIRTVVRNKDWRDSLTLFTATAKESPRSVNTLTALGAVHIRSNEWEEAKKYLAEAENIYRDNSHLQNLLGIVADHDKNYGLAEEKYKRSLELNPDAINTNINLAEMYFKQGKYQEAGENLLKVIEFYPVPEYVVRYAYTQIALDRPDEALAVMEKYYGRNLNHPDLCMVVGTAYLVKKDYPRVLEFLRKAQELGSNDPKVKQMIEIAEEKARIPN